MPPLHYYSDIWIADELAGRGYTFRVTAGFDFVHLWSEVGRHGDRRHVADRMIYESRGERLVSES